eukprot:1015050-Amorphochlora_amoeboformis.AAC.1
MSMEHVVVYTYPILLEAEDIRLVSLQHLYDISNSLTVYLWQARLSLISLRIHTPGIVTEVRLTRGPSKILGPKHVVERRGGYLYVGHSMLNTPILACQSESGIHPLTMAPLFLQRRWLALHGYIFDLGLARNGLGLPVIWRGLVRILSVHIADASIKMNIAVEAGA